MTTVALHQLLSTPVVTRVISTIKTPMTRFQDFFGAGPGGPNTNPVGGHFTGWDIFDKTRKIATGRAPGTGPATRTPQIIGHVNATMYRAHEKIYLLDERIFRTRPLGQYGRVDVGGQTYVTNQQRYLAQIFRNNREFMISRMLRGQFYLKQVGESFVPVDSSSGAQITIDYQVPAGNKNQLDMLGAGAIIDEAWSATTANIIQHCLKVNAAFEQLHGYPLRHIWVNSNTFYYMTQNTELINMGGTSNTPFSLWTPDGLRSPDGIPSTGFEFRFRGLPWISVHVYDAGLDVDGTYTKFIPDNIAIMLPDIDNNIFEMHEGSELVRENVTDSASERFGLAAWTEPTTQPSGFQLLALDNCLPVLYLPKTIVYATVAGF